MAGFYIKQGDLLPAIQSTLQDSTGASLDVTGCTVRFQMRSKDTGRLFLDAAAVVTSPSTGGVRYDWAAGDTDAAGDFEAEWQVTFPSGKTGAAPTNKMIAVTIVRDVR